MKYRFEYLPYRRKFTRPLATARGLWEYREGLVIRLETEDGNYGFGEVAPVPWFGTETLDGAFDWCKGQGEWIDLRNSLPVDLPCCQWAVFSAQSAIEEEPLKRVFPVAGLVTGPRVFEEKQVAGFQTFKLKIGVANPEVEQAQVDGLVSELEDGQCLRLDANGGLSERDFKSWLDFLEGKPIDYLEQPLEVSLENRMLELVEPYSTSLALDESVTGLDSLKRWENWPGVLVVKPSLLGWVEENNLPRMTGSSVFETAFGFEASLQFLARHQKTDTAIGYDTNALLEKDGWSIRGSGSTLAAGEVTNADLQTLWEEKRETVS